MRKKILGATFVVAMAATAGYNMYVNQAKSKMSDMALANVEALANNESESNLDCEGLLGICSMDCEDCGFSWWAFGSKLVGTHNCSQH